MIGYDEFYCSVPEKNGKSWSSIGKINNNTQISLCDDGVSFTATIKDKDIPQDLKKENNMMKIQNMKRVIFNKPYTIVIWKNGQKTIAKCSENDIYDEEIGLMHCIMQYYFGKQYKRFITKKVKETKEKCSKK